MISWAEEVEKDEEAELYLDGETIHGDQKMVTEYKRNEEGKRVRITRFYKMERKLVSKSIAMRKSLKKYGRASSDPPGPNPADTIVCEELFMQFLSEKEEEHGQDDKLLKLRGQKLVKCRLCQNDHWTTQCPFKDKLAPAQEKEEPKPESPAVQPASEKMKAGKYVPPSMRDGANKRGESMTTPRSKDDSATVRVTNLCEDVKDSDLQELFRPFGSISRIFLAKDKVTGLSKGFAFVSFHRREDAARAIAKVNGFGYAHLILSVEWAKPSSGGG